MAEIKKKKISDLDQIQNDQTTGRPIINEASLMEVAEPELQGTNYESKSVTIEQIRNFIFEKAFPVGSIYMSTSNRNPKYLFGGEWQAFAVGKTIFGVDTSKSDDNNFKPGATGGAKTVTLTAENLPQHKHEVKLANKMDTGAIEFAVRNPYQPKNSDPVTPSVYVPRTKGAVTKPTEPGTINHLWSAGTVVKGQDSDENKKADVVSVNMPGISTTAKLSNVGIGKPFSLLPPYVTCYIWKRTK